MSEESKVVAYVRSESGSASSRRLRRDGWVPGVMNTEEGESRLVRLSLHDFEAMLHHHTSENLVLDLEVEGEKARKVLLKEVQHDPLTGKIVHADFMEISMTKMMRVGVPITLIGEPVGVLQDEGVLEHLLRVLEVECLPTELVEEVEADVSALKIGDALQVGDLKVNPNWTVVTPADMAVASVQAPRLVEEEVKPEEEEETEGGEPKVIGEEGKEEQKTEEAAEGEKGEK